MGVISRGTTLSASASGLLFRSKPNRAISLPAIGTREEESFATIGDGML